MSAPFDVAIIERDTGAPVAARRPTGEWVALRGGTLARATILALEWIVAHPVDPESAALYVVMPCPTEAPRALAALCSAVLGSYDALARGLPDRALAYSALSMMLAVAAQQAGADNATIAACSAAARKVRRSAPRKGVYS